MYGNSCIDVSYENSMDALLNTTLKGGMNRIWFFETCTLYGFYQTCDPGFCITIYVLMAV